MLSYLHTGQTCPKFTCPKDTDALLLPHRVDLSHVLLRTWFPLYLHVSLIWNFPALPIYPSGSSLSPWGSSRPQSVFCIYHVWNGEITICCNSGLKVALGDCGGELGPSAGACTELSLTQAGKVQKIPLLERGQWPQESATGDSEAVSTFSRNTKREKQQLP